MAFHISEIFLRIVETLNIIQVSLYGDFSNDDNDGVCGDYYYGAGDDL
jgi:hypothetical protein